MNECKLEKFSFLLSILYIILPIVIFFFGWIKVYFALPFSAVVVYFGYCLYKQLSINIGRRIFTRKNLPFWIVSLICICIWVYFSGIGSFSFQNRDFWVRNPIYRDLCINDWPVIFDLSLEPAYAQVITGTSKVAFSYYFTWWLPAALVAKCFTDIETAKNIALYIWTVLGCIIVLINIVHILGECKYRYLFILIFFSGLDVVGYLICGNAFSLVEHMEWWPGFMIQYTSNTAQLYWVFNQSIPIWIITGLLLQLRDNKYIGGLCAMMFAYSPWATIGVFPFAFIGSFREKEKICNAFNVSNILIVAVLAIGYGLFYISASGSSGGIGTTLSYYRNDLFRFICIYVLFVFLECGAYLILSFKENKNDMYYYVVTAELLLFPLVWMRDGNFTMRASIPALFILMIYVMKTISNSNAKYLKTILAFSLLIGSCTAFNEINRSLINTIKYNIRGNEEEVYSFGQFRSEVESTITISKDQFFIYNYENAPFFKYLGK